MNYCDDCGGSLGSFHQVGSPPCYCTGSSNEVEESPKTEAKNTSWGHGEVIMLSVAAVIAMWVLFSVLKFLVGL